jgi:polysaccharide deacetylase family protein (PEP-CTERM system associated)
MENKMSERENSAANLVHTMSVDVEDYFQVEAFAGSVSSKEWDAFPSRVFDNTLRVLDLFDAHNVKATFFFVGWVADKFPSLVRETQRRGHEIACHSYWHRPVYKLTPREFREDTRRARLAIEQAGGTRVIGYRAPTWSITAKCLWALDILAEEGFVYDSSIYPIHHDLYGVPNAQRFPYSRLAANGASLHEFPPATVSLMGMTLPAAGGGYLRIFPLAYTDFAFRQIGRSAKQPVSVYFHPWEIDPGQPRIPAGLKSRFRHYTNLHRMERRLIHIMSRHTFGRYCDRLTTAEAEPGFQGHAALAR